MLRDHSGHSTTFILPDSGVQPGWDPDGFTLVQVGTRVAVLVPLPDTAVQCVNPARCHPVQLTTQAGRTRCTTLLISYSIRVICTWLYTRYVHKKVQSSICSYIRGHMCLNFCLVCIFSVHFQEWNIANKTLFYIILLYFVFPTKKRAAARERPKLTLSTPESRVKSDILDSLSCFWCVIALCSHQIKTPQPWVSSERGGTGELCVASWKLPNCKWGK